MDRTQRAQDVKRGRKRQLLDGTKPHRHTSTQVSYNKKNTSRKQPGGQVHDVNASGGTGADVITMLQRQQQRRRRRLRRGGGARTQ